MTSTATAFWAASITAEPVLGTRFLPLVNKLPPTLVVAWRMKLRQIPDHETNTVGLVWRTDHPLLPGQNILQ